MAAEDRAVPSRGADLATRAARVRRLQQPVHRHHPDAAALHQPAAGHLDHGALPDRDQQQGHRLAGVDLAQLSGRGTLYQVSPLADTARPLLVGTIPDQSPEPIAWTNVNKNGGRVFYTSLGHLDDFQQEPFNRLLVNALRRHARDRGAALLVLHDIALAGAACDRLVLMLAGRVLAEGTPAEVLRPEVLSPAYGTQVDVVADPATGQPLVAPRIAR